MVASALPFLHIWTAPPALRAAFSLLTGLAAGLSFPRPAGKAPELENQKGSQQLIFTHFVG